MWSSEILEQDLLFKLLNATLHFSLFENVADDSSEL